MGKVFYVSGGGSALNDLMQSLSSAPSNTGSDPHIVYVGPGVYDPLDRWEMYRSVNVISQEGKEKTIIDAKGNGRVTWKVYTNTSYPLKFTGFTLRNGYVECTEEGVWISVVGYYTDFYDCRICNNTHIVTGTKKAYPQSYTHLAMNCTFMNCELDHNSTNNIGWRYSSFYGCDIHDNVMEATDGDQYSFGVLDRCLVHDNYAAGFMAAAGRSTIFYNNDVRFLLERPNPVINCVFFRNKGRLVDQYGMSSFIYNCVFLENNPASTASPDNTVLVSLLNRSDNYLINNVFDVAQSAAWSSNGTSSIGGLSGNHYEVTDPGFIDAENLNFRIKKDAFVRGRGFDLSQVRISSGQSSQANMATLDSRKFKWQQPSCGAYEYYDSDEFLNPSGVRVPIGTQLLLLDDDQTYHSEVEYVECSTNTLVDTKFFPSGGTYFFHLDYSCADPFTGSPEMEVWGCWGGGANWNCWANKENASSLTLVSGTEGAGNRVVREKALTGTSTKSIGLFSWVGVQHACAAGVKIYRYQVREGNASGRLLQDYVPVRRGTQGMFFDRVHKKLILPSSGFLTPGSDVAAQSSQPV